MSLGVLAGSDTELSEMPPQTDPLYHESLHDCIQTLCLLFFSSDIYLTKFFDIVIPILGTLDVVVYKLYYITCLDSRIIIEDHIWVTVFLP